MIVHELVDQVVEILSVVTPGLTSFATSMSRHSATRRPARAHALEIRGAVQLDAAAIGGGAFGGVLIGHLVSRRYYFDFKPNIVGGARRS